MSNETMTLEWTGEDLQNAKRSEVNIFFHGTTHEELLDGKGLPNDLHLVEYELNGERHYDGVRAYKKSSIFDVYYDKLNPIGGKVIAIRSGYGNIKPKLFNYNQKSEEK